MAKGDSRGRCVTGVEGLDTILGGGIPACNIVLVAGGTGTGKTTLGFEFLVRGANAGDKGLLISTVESEQKLLANIPSFNFLDPKALKNGTISIVELKEIAQEGGLSVSNFDQAAIDKLVLSIGALVSKTKAKRLVIDTLDTILAEVQDDALDTYLLVKLSESLYKNQCTAILVASMSCDHEIEGAVADGIIRMDNYERKGDLLRTLQVLKMKGTSHSRAKYVVDLTESGVLMTTLLKGGS